MLVNSYGDAKFCENGKCAWWDEVRRQCAVKTFLLKDFTPSLNEIVSMITDKNHIVLDFGDEE
jgi:hypothetical protein